MNSGRGDDNGNNNDDSTIANESISGSKSNRLLENLFRAMVVKEASFNSRTFILSLPNVY